MYVVHYKQHEVYIYMSTFVLKTNFRLLLSNITFHGILTRLINYVNPFTCIHLYSTHTLDSWMS